MKKSLTSNYLELLATSTFVTAYHYRVLLLLLTGSYTQSQLAEKLGMKRQNVHRCVKELEEHGYILVDRVEGRNKFIKANTSVSAILATDDHSEGQLKFDDTSE
ncbi:MAG: MarR family transcriptional regulator [Ruminococcus sp.]|nr:MarR family transcriptional regulator [Ruminococcus sp.]